MSDEKQGLKVKEWLAKLKTKEIKKEQALILLLFGILLIVIAIPVKDESDAEAKPASYDEAQAGVKDAETEGAETEFSGADQYCGVLEERLKRMLMQVSGAGKVEVMITLKYTQGMVVEKDQELASSTVEETDSAGGVRNSTETSRNESTIYTNGSETPFVVKQSLPEIEGVLVVCSGGGNPVVKTEITEAVHALFDVEAHKIRIMKMK